MSIRLLPGFWWWDAVQSTVLYGPNTYSEANATDLITKGAPRS